MGDHVYGRFSVEDLLAFDRSKLAHPEQEPTDWALSNFRDLYLNHLVIARHLDRWAENLEEGFGLDAEFRRGVVHALREVAAHLRQADYVPSGTLYSDTVDDWTEHRRRLEGNI